MNKTSTEILQKYSNVGSFALLNKNKFALFGNESNDDLVVIGTSKHHDVDFFIDGNSARINKKTLLALSNSVDSLTASSAFATFLMTSNVIRLLKETIKKLNATHLRIHNIENLIRISIFDYRKFLPNSMIQRENTQKIKYYETDNANIGGDFTCTIFASSFNKLPNQDMNIRVGKNGICQFEPLNEKVKFLFRDQEIVEPITTFFSDRLGCQISLSLAPKS